MVRAICCENPTPSQGVERGVNKNVLITLIALSVILSLSALGAMGVNQTVGVALVGSAGFLALLNIVLIIVDRCRTRESTSAVPHPEPSTPQESIPVVHARPISASLFRQDDASLAENEAHVVRAHFSTPSLFTSGQEFSDGLSSVALGKEFSDGLSSVALGKESSDDGLSSVALGQESSDDGLSSVTSEQEFSDGLSSVALGKESSDDGLSSVALGQESSDDGLSSVTSEQEFSDDGLSSEDSESESSSVRAGARRDALLDAPTQPLASGNDTLDNSSDTILDPNPNPAGRGPILKIFNGTEDDQIKAFRIESPFNVDNTYQHYETCDQYLNCVPSDQSRILVDGKPTNGAKIWDKLILIQGPHNDTHIQDMQKIVDKENVGAVVRIGQFYIDYKKYKLSKVHMLALENWKDFRENNLRDIYELILALERIEGPIMIHCRGGVGRTGTFAACWYLYQLKKDGVALVDPMRIVKELRSARAEMIQTEGQFQMILDFIRYLNDPR